MTRKRIAYYISSHGFGHAARSAIVLGELARDYELFITSEIPEAYYRTVVPAFHFRSAPVDTGCVQADFVTVDQGRSFKNLADLLSRAEEISRRETTWLRDNAIDLVISDAPSIPLKAAAEARLPSIVMSNFTWYDIYSGFEDAPQHSGLISTLREHYACATLQVAPQMHVDNTVIPRREEVGLLSLPGENIRDRIARHAPREYARRPHILIYLGQYDSTSFHWAGLAEMEEYLFLTRDPVPSGAGSPNLMVLDETFRFPDLIASSDLVVTKGGYSTLATAFVHGVPVLTCERTDFKEFEAVRAYLLGNEIGIILDVRPFYGAKWADSIKKALNLTVKDKVRLNGEREIHDLIDRLFQ